MRKRWICLIFLGLLLFAFPAAAEQTEAQDAWTVLIYMCGSDLESKYSYGTANLEEIATVEAPKSTVRDELEGISNVLEAAASQNRKVNILIETGGSKEWHAQKLGMNVRTDLLQDWEYQPATVTATGSFALRRGKPLASMADPDTLTDFIRWGKENYPAEKYMLVLWDHGGGSATGILIDELFNGEYMTLDLLNKALRDGGIHFEAVLFDACLMANIETACAIRDHANWMIASEEVVAGKGTAFGEWLQELIYVPICDGRMLGRWICDTAMIKYADTEDDQAQALLTWSVINLDKIDRMAEYFDTFFKTQGILYAQYPQVLASFANAGHFSGGFGSGQENMYDFGGILFDPVFRTAASAEMQMVLQENLAETVDYCVRGSGRSAARGISFCYATNFTPERLDIYARNCPSANYLAMLDAISAWEAPDWVYDKVDKIPEPADENTYRVTIEKKIWEQNGSPAFSVTSGRTNVSTVLYKLYQKDELTGEIIRLGKIPVYYDTEAGIYRVYDLMTWPAIDGNLCELELQNMPTKANPDVLYNIPVMIDSETMNMRGAYWFNEGEYEIFGLWDNYDNDSGQFNRNVKSLSQIAGQEFSLLYQVKGSENIRGGKPLYLSSPLMTMYRSLKVEERILPPGTYYLQFVIVDTFMREMCLDLVELHCDGQKMTIVDDSWKGSVTLDPKDFYAK